MSRFDVVVESPIYDSFRVQQVAGLFDLPLGEKSKEVFSAELPDESEAWNIGMIVGGSGSGKSTIARHAFCETLYQGRDWEQDRAVIDCFGKVPVKKVVELFTAVGFSSPPSWVKPYRVLSCGEQFRCDLAKSLILKERTEIKEQGNEQNPIVVFDEYTSVVDRNVAKICSAAISKGIKKGNISRRFVAVTCHYDVAEWLEPDWILEMPTGRLSRRSLRRPEIKLEVHRCRVDAWGLFAKHHYLSGSLSSRAWCYLITWDGEPVALCATLPVITKRRHRRFSRVVTLPDFQGIGIGMRSLAAVAEIERQEGYRINIMSSHPAVIRHCRDSKIWKTISVKRTGGMTKKNAKYRSSSGRAVVSFEYAGENGYEVVKKKKKLP